MATANDIINGAARRIGVLGEEEALSTAAAVDCLTMLNDMLHGLRTRGVQYAHTTLAATGIVNVPDQLIDALKWLQAEAISSDFNVTLTPKQETQVDQARHAFFAYYLSLNPAVPDTALRRRRWGLSNFVRGD